MVSMDEGNINGYYGYEYYKWFLWMKVILMEDSETQICNDAA
jgi:hypothetical protein